MWTSNADHAILRIEQIGAVDAKGNGKHFWGLHWVLNTGPKKPLQNGTVRLEEPFTPKQYDKVAKYLDEALDDPNFDQTQANTDSDRLDDYRQKLFDRLKLISIVDAVRGKCLEIHIWPDKEHESGRRSIHSIQWEQLEELKLWAKGAEGPEEAEGVKAQEPRKGVQSVTVCRHIHVEESVKIESEEALRAAREGRNGTFDVLLVIARPHIHDSPELPRKVFSVLNPATIRSVLLQLQEQLRSTGSSQRIRLEIVRPGRLVELTDHLENRKKMYKGQRPYHVIHFDMHGGVENGNAVLEFNEYKKESNILLTTREKADDVACLLRSHNVACVILSVCKSAVAHDGPSANLSSVFLRHGVSAVLAMSHNMHDSISKRYFSRFYKEIFVEHASLETAASEARKALCDDRIRWSYGRERRVSIQDWFIPVLYTSRDEPYTLSSHRPWNSWALFGIIPTLEWLFLVVSVLVYFLLPGQLCSWIEDGVRYCPSPSGLLSALLSSIFVRAILRLRRYWQIRQRLSVLAEDRQNALRIEGDIRKGKMVFIHSEEDVEGDANPFINCLAVIWECTHFAAFRGVIEAEWFLQPGDLTLENDWKLWVKACTNMIWLWVYCLGDRHFSSTEEARSVIIIENLDLLYLEKEELKDVQCYAFAQRRLEDWLQKHFTNQNNKDSPPYLMLTACRGKALGDDVSRWIKEGPGRCGVLESIIVTTFVKTSQAHIDPTNSSFDERKWYDWTMSWISGNVI